MQTRTKAIIITLIFAAIAFMLNRVLWTPSTDMGMPTPEQLPFFIFLSILEALAFGLGIAFIVIGWPLLKNASGTFGKRAKGMFICITWYMISWWPHDNFHMQNGNNLQGLLHIEYAFHFTLILAGLYLAWSIYSILKETQKK